MKSGLITAKMKEDGVYDNWRSIKHKISTEWKKKIDMFAADSKQLKALGQRAQPTRDKYKIYGYSVMFLHFISTFLYIYIYRQFHFVLLLLHSELLIIRNQSKPFVFGNGVIDLQVSTTTGLVVNLPVYTIIIHLVLNRL